MANQYEENVGSAEVLTPQNSTLLLIDHQVGLMQADWRRDEALGWPYAMVFREHLPSWGDLPDTAMAYASGEMTPPSEK